MADIVLTTLNSSYGHSSLALRYLQANLGVLAEQTAIHELVIGERPADVVETILAESPTIVGFGVYVWNVSETLEVVRMLKAVQPGICIVVGGPEVSYEHESSPLAEAADHVIVGEGEVAFRELCERLLGGRPVLSKVQPERLPELSRLETPYPLYTDHDIHHRAIYVEASRGCPFSCEFCLSSIPTKVRQFDLEAFLADLDELHRRGARQFRFIDRTFNLNYRVSRRILQFFLDRIDSGVFVHFEMVPDRFPDKLRELVTQFPPGSLQFEIGIQTLDPETATRIGRAQDSEAALANLRFLREQSNVHIHADLIAGLPGEDLESFGRGFNLLWAQRPHEIQLGILKRLKGTPIARHDRAWGMVYSESPPYEVLATSLIPFTEMQRVKRAARVWDVVANSGNFGFALELFERRGDVFGELLSFSDWLHARVGAFVGISLQRLCQLTIEFFAEHVGHPAAEVGALIARSYAAPGRRLPKFLAEFADSIPQPKTPNINNPATPKRQGRHLASSHSR